MTRALSMATSRTVRALTLGVSLAISTSWPALAEEPAASSAHAVPSPDGIPDGQSRFPIDDANPTASLPAADQRSAHPLEYGYMLLEMTGLGCWSEFLKMGPA